MADSDTPPPSSARPGPERESPGRDPAGSEDVDARVRQQRRHIEGLDGRDPLRPGIDD
ncbi:hypothetical protein [Phenylobacterium sp.]|uniref:hypothetical protein n=1 Tax=Phenylobacterium sp. TaxID=1871053 RepID=UPI00300153DC